MSSSSSSSSTSAVPSPSVAPAPVPAPAAAPAPAPPQPTLKQSSRGHVFIFNADILRVASDVVGISSKGWLRSCPWFQALPDDLRTGMYTGEHTRPAGSISNLTAKIRDKLPTFIPDIFNISLGGSDTDWFLARTVEFIKASTDICKTRPPKFGRAKHLILLPAYGVRYGGGKAYAGPIVEGIMKLLYEAAKNHNMDFALVTTEQTVYQAALTVRSRSIPQDDAYCDEDLPREFKRLAGPLVQHAQREELVIFLGAGCSVAAGLPQWGQLLEDLAKSAGMSQEERNNLWKLNHLDQARIIERRLGGSDKLTAAVRDRIEGRMYAPIHALLQALPSVEAVTTNYDTLYEQAVVCAGKSISVLPYQDTKGVGSERSKWVLKMHGCVSRPEDIVLTREDYIRYNERRQALAGIVQALMLTKHMLFVGFSLSDTNFLNIASTVKKALMSRKRNSTDFGTALQLIQNPLVDELWEGDIRMINMAESIDKPIGADWNIAARRAEIFLDYCVNRSLAGAATNHLMDPTYDVLLSDGERMLSTALRSFLDNLPSEARGSPAFRKIATVVKDLGGDYTDQVLQKQLKKAASAQIQKKKKGKKQQSQQEQGAVAAGAAVKKLASNPMWSAIAMSLEKRQLAAMGIALANLDNQPETEPQSSSSSSTPSTAPSDSSSSSCSSTVTSSTAAEAPPTVAASSVAQTSGSESSTTSSTVSTVAVSEMATETLPMSPRTEESVSVQGDDSESLDTSLDEDIASLEIMIDPIMPVHSSEEEDDEHSSELRKSGETSALVPVVATVVNRQNQINKEDSDKIASTATQESSKEAKEKVEAPAEAPPTAPAVPVESTSLLVQSPVEKPVPEKQESLETASADPKK